MKKLLVLIISAILTIGLFVKIALIISFNN